MSRAREALRQQTLLQTLLGDTGGERWPGAASDARAECPASPASPAGLAAWTRDGHHLQRGLQAYQAHAGALAGRVLAAAHPALAQVLGERSFADLARAFWRHGPPTCGDLAQWGAGLPAFVATAHDGAEAPCLADLARLEWAVHGAASAADSTAAPFGLQHLAETDAAQLLLVPQAGTVLVDSAHPVVSIWRAHAGRAVGDLAALQACDAAADEGAGDTADRSAKPSAKPSADPAADPAAHDALALQRAEPALVWRQGWRVQVAALGVAEARFTRRILQGQALGAALLATAAEADADTGTATSTATEPGFDFQRWLLLQLQRGWLAGVGPAGRLR